MRWPERHSASANFVGGITTGRQVKQSTTRQLIIAILACSGSFSCGEPTQTETIVFVDPQGNSETVKDGITLSSSSSSCTSANLAGTAVKSCTKSSASGGVLGDAPESQTAGGLGSAAEGAGDTSQTAAADGGESSETPRVAKFSPAEIYFNLADNCGRCHDWTESEATVTVHAADSAARIRSGNMPKGSPSWRDTADGKALIQYLESR
jgi:hypothetical protein